MKFSWIVLFVCLSSFAYSQQPDTVLSDNKVFLAVDQQAEFPGGHEGLATFLRQNIAYPKKARKKNTQGKVFVKFIVERDGSLSDIEVLKGVSPELDKEALRVVSISPVWVPAQHEGKVVRSQFVLPIYFMLN